MSAIFKREFKSYFSTPIGFVIVAAFVLFSGMFFSVIYASGSPNIEAVISTLSTVVIFATPFITMRLISEDRRQKVDQALLTAPISVTDIVLGKFFAALALFCLGISVTLVYQFIVTALVSVNWLIFLYSFLGIVLLGCVMISIGMFISSLTESPVVSAALTFAVFLAVMLLGSYAASNDSAVLTAINSAVSFIDRFNSFCTGIFNLADVVYMVSVSFLFIVLTVRSVEKRRWA